MAVSSHIFSRFTGGPGLVVDPADVVVGAVVVVVTPQVLVVFKCGTGNGQGHRSHGFQSRSCDDCHT